MVRLIIFNIDTSSCKIGWSLPYLFETQQNLLGFCILCESESLFLIRSMHDQKLLIPHTFYHITTTSKHPDRATNDIIAPINTYYASYLVAIVYPKFFGDLFMTLYSI